jgi:hypothetical protein
MANTPQSLLPHIEAAIADGSFVKLVLSKYRGQEATIKRIDVRLVDVQGQPHLSFVTKHATNDVTENRPVDAGLRAVDALLGNDFRAGYLFGADREIEVLFNRKGVGRIFVRKGQSRAVPHREHNRKKNHLLTPDAPFLLELGVIDKSGRVKPTMAPKWRQINRYLELFDAAFAKSALAAKGSLHVVDFGAGKGYLTFALYHHLRHNLGLDATVTGVELRGHLVASGNDVARRLGFSGLTMSEGDVNHFPLPATDVLVALHACDTATDLALFSGLRAGAGMLLASPCCHKELRSQITIPDVLQPVLRYGIQLEREAEMVTDSLRALLLEEQGYKVQLMEFVAPEHTDKNKLLVATRRPAPMERTPIRRQIDTLKAFYGISQQRLDSLLHP